MGGGRRGLGKLSQEVAGPFGDEAQHEFEVYVPSLPAGEVNAWQVIEWDRQRADTQNVFDELKPQWGLDGFCCRTRNGTALAARLGLLFDKLGPWFVRLLGAGRQVERAGGRRWFLRIAARLVQRGRQKMQPNSVSGKGWEPLRAGDERVCAWWAATAPQLQTGTLAGPISNQIAAAPA